MSRASRWQQLWVDNFFVRAYGLGHVNIKMSLRFLTQLMPTYSSPCENGCSLTAYMADFSQRLALSFVDRERSMGGVGTACLLSTVTPLRGKLKLIMIRGRRTCISQITNSCPTSRKITRSWIEMLRIMHETQAVQVKVQGVVRHMHQVTSGSSGTPQ